jgi:hypothetical protein
MTESIWPMLMYQNQPVVTIDGQRFDSKAEARRCGELLLLQRAGAIRELRRQVPFEIIPAQIDRQGKTVYPASYLADFVYEEVDSHGRWNLVVEDLKGIRSEADCMKRKLMLQVHGIDVREFLE